MFGAITSAVQTLAFTTSKLSANEPQWPVSGSVSYRDQLLSVVIAPTKHDFQVASELKGSRTLIAKDLDSLCSVLMCECAPLLIN